jgi:hypothetical protein
MVRLTRAVEFTSNLNLPSPVTTGSLAVSRPRQYADMLRDYRIILDGREVGTVSRGAELRLDLPIGEHEVVARIDWARSNFFKVMIREGELTELEVGSNIYGWRFLAIIYFITVGYSRYLYLRHRLQAFPVDLK